MKPFSEHDLLNIWERGLGLHPIDQALVMLDIADTNERSKELMNLSIGQRDMLLMKLRQLTMGSHAAGKSQCPHCNEQVEFDIDLAELSRAHAMDAPAREFTFEEKGYRLFGKVPDSLDIAAAAQCNDELSARYILLQRCILKAEYEGDNITWDEVPEDIIFSFSEETLRTDPMAEVQFSVSCPTCSYQWPEVFDIVSYFWSEISDYVKRLLRDVHLLARVYGWSEADILAMSPNRRRIYMEMIYQ